MDSEDEDDPQPLSKQSTLAIPKTLKLNQPRGGFSNRNSNGYGCAVFELLFSLPPFVEWLTKEEFAMGTVSRTLAELYSQLCSKQLPDAESFISRIGCYESSDHTGDAHMFLSDVLHMLNVEEENEGLCDIREMFHGVIKVTDKCSGCDTEREEKHESSIYPIYLDSNASVQEAINEYDSPLSIICEKCQNTLVITQTISNAPNVLILKVDDIVGAPNIDLSVVFGHSSYDLTGIILKQSTHFQTISRSNGFWFHYNDSSVRSIKVGQLLVNNDIKGNLNLAVYIKVLDVNNNNTVIKTNGSAKVKCMPSTNENNLAETSSTEDKALFEENNFQLSSNGGDFEDSLSPQKTKAAVWSPKTPIDLTAQLAVAEVCKLDTFDPLLTEDDVDGAKLPYPVNESVGKKALVRWLKCRGAPTANLNMKELVERINIRIQNKSFHVIDPSIDNFKHYNKKKKALEDQNVSSRPPFLPILGWRTFPSVDIPDLFNWGHAHVYLIETAPNWTTAFDFSDNEDEIFSQDIAESVGQTNIPNKGKRFLHSDHIIEIADCKNEEYYFVKARIQASMANNVYFTSVTIRIVSGSVRDSSCYCKQRSLGRCSHVAALLLYITRHIEEKGYAALSCTDKPCAWGKGSKEKDPGLVTKIYKTSTNRIRSCFSPLPTAEQHKTDEDLVIIKDSFLKSVQRLYVTEPKYQSKNKTGKKGTRKKTAGKTSGKKTADKTTEESTATDKTAAKAKSEEPDFEYLFDLHLEYSYEPYCETVENLKIVIQLCKSFAKERLDVPTRGPLELAGAEQQSEMWHARRCVYFPSSVSKRVCHMTAQGYKNFLREHLWQMSKFRGNKATKYGTTNEPTARTAYEEILKRTDPSVEIEETGMWTNTRYPEFSCSPDGIIKWNSGVCELIEIKCPLLMKTGNPNNFEKNLSKKQINRFCLQRKNGKVSLKRDHPFFYQIQMAMGVTELLKCHFVVWSPKDMFYEEVNFDPAFFCNMIIKMGPLFWKLVVPEYFFMRTPRRLDPCMLHYTAH